MHNNPVKDWFYFTRHQRYGILVMLALIVALPIAGKLLERNRKHRGMDDATVSKVINDFETHLARLEKEAAKRAEEASTAARADYQRSAIHQHMTLQPKPFDPNMLTLEEWTSMGISARIARSIRNYLAAGGRFRYKQDLQRIYLVDDTLYAALKPYIRLPDREDHQRTFSENRSLPEKSQKNDSLIKENQYGVAEQYAHEPGMSAHKGRNESAGPDLHRERPSAFEPPTVQLNKADTTDLQKLRGIGPVFSRRIVRYRELLGGYYCSSQLLEVFGMDTTRFESISKHMETDTLSIRTININEASFGDLVRHPYIEQPVASAILSMRDQHGPFECKSHIRNSYLVDDELWEKIRLYVCISP